MGSHTIPHGEFFFLVKMTFMMILIEICYHVGKKICSMTSFYGLSIELEELCTLAKRWVITFHEK